MQTKDFDFHLPRERIAQRPASPRDGARLLRVGAEVLSDHVVHDLPTLLRPEDILIVNDTKVIPARLFGRRDDAIIEVTLHKELAAGRWAAFAKPARKLTLGDRFEVAPDFTATVAEKLPGGEVVLDFSLDADRFLDRLLHHGKMPLPPYIERTDGADSGDVEDYQSLFAAREGAVAAPTASLHFTPGLVKRLAERGIKTARVTLHVGAGTFLPVKAEQAEDHVMHAEYGELGASTIKAIAAARAKGGRVVAVGTTSLRILESAAGTDGALQPFKGETSLFILPGYPFRCVDLLLTNFHLPCSTLFMLVSAFSGLKRMKAAYAYAIEKNYRFYSYGDACLLERQDDLP